MCWFVLQNALTGMLNNQRMNIIAFVSSNAFDIARANDKRCGEHRTDYKTYAFNITRFRGEIFKIWKDVSEQCGATKAGPVNWTALDCTACKLYVQTVESQCFQNLYLRLLCRHDAVSISPLKIEKQINVPIFISNPLSLISTRIIFQFYSLSNTTSQAVVIRRFDTATTNFGALSSIV